MASVQKRTFEKEEENKFFEIYDTNHDSEISLEEFLKPLQDSFRELISRVDEMTEDDVKIIKDGFSEMEEELKILSEKRSQKCIIS
jgi:Ca2+-binding EF-hand superfamily protein